jgi:hypothetical protein
VPTHVPACAPEHVAYATASGGLIAWLNDAFAILCTHMLHVTLPSGSVLAGDATLDKLPPGMHLILQGAGRSGASATTLDFERKDPVELQVNDVRVEFRNMSLVNVRCRYAGALG